MAREDNNGYTQPAGSGWFGRLVGFALGQLTKTPIVGGIFGWLAKKLAPQTQEFAGYQGSAAGDSATPDTQHNSTIFVPETQYSRPEGLPSQEGVQPAPAQVSVTQGVEAEALPISVESSGSKFPDPGSAALVPLQQQQELAVAVGQRKYAGHAA